MTAFADLGLSEPTLQALQDVGYERVLDGGIALGAEPEMAMA